MRTTDTKTLTTHIGLSAREIIVIKSIFNLSRKLKAHFEFAESDRLQNANLSPDVVFVDADDTESMDLWHDIRAHNPLTIPIMISATSEKIEDQITLTRPLVLKRLISTLESVTCTQSASQTKTTTNEDNMAILVIDDSYPVRKYLEKKLPQLSSHFLCLDFASSGEEAIQKITEHYYPIVFLDVVMPGMDGYKVCKRIKASNQNSFVVMLTSKKSPFDRVRGKMSGCDAFVTKPPSDDKLRQIIEDRWQVFSTPDQLTG